MRLLSRKPNKCCTLRALFNSWSTSKLRSCHTKAGTWMNFMIFLWLRVLSFRPSWIWSNTLWLILLLSKSFDVLNTLDAVGCFKQEQFFLYPEERGRRIRFIYHFLSLECQIKDPSRQLKSFCNTCNLFLVNFST